MVFRNIPDVCGTPSLLNSESELARNALVFASSWVAKCNFDWLGEDGNGELFPFPSIGPIGLNLLLRFAYLTLEQTGSKTSEIASRITS